MEYKRLNDYLNELKFNERAGLLSIIGKERLAELEHALKQLTLTDVGCSLPSKEERVAYAEEIVKKFGVTEIHKKETWLNAFHHGFRYAKSFISKR